jgi:hypothetical protein
MGTRRLTIPVLIHQCRHEEDHITRMNILPLIVTWGTIKQQVIQVHILLAPTVIRMASEGSHFQPFHPTEQAHITTIIITTGLADHLHQQFLHHLMIMQIRQSQKRRSMGVDHTSTKI